MERILIAMDGRHASWEAFSRSVSLAKRIDARLHVLFVPSAAREPGRHAEIDQEAGVRRRLELLIEAAKGNGAHVDYFVSEGSFEEEVVRFAESHKITLLVAENGDGERRPNDRDVSSLEKIWRRISCRVELVSPKKDNELRTQGENE